MEESAEEPAEYIPFRSHIAPQPEGVEETTRPRPGKPSTLSSMLIALAPLLGLAFIAALAAATDGYTTWPIIALALATGSVSSYALANVDQRLLAERRFTRPTSPVWALLPAVYLFTRGNRAYLESGDGMGPAWAHVAVLLVVIGGVNAFSVIVLALQALTTMLAERVGLG